MEYCLLFNGSSGYTNAPQFYLIRTLPVLLQISIIYFDALVHQLHIGNATTYTAGMWNYSPVSRAGIQMHPELIICLEEFCESKITVKEEFLSRNTTLRPGGRLSRILTNMCDAIRSVRISALTWALVFSAGNFFSAHHFHKSFKEFATSG